MENLGTKFPEPTVNIARHLGLNEAESKAR
jgi:hypothetical protein